LAARLAVRTNAIKFDFKLQRNKTGTICNLIFQFENDPGVRQITDQTTIIAHEIIIISAGRVQHEAGVTPSQIHLPHHTRILE
jgi:hypothetical protein